ncbi:UNVERIFIED_CONTAM: hypothetical protein GTU68_046845 [Idotea baltica]|nr:hypothetical protein [Idotea baltica]
MVNLGTPDSPSRSDVKKYLTQFLTDGRVIDKPWLFRQFLVRGVITPFRSGQSAKLYEKLWTERGSPLKYYGEDLLDGVNELLPDNYFVEFAMRYQSPSMEDGLQKLLKRNIQKLIIYPLFPHYASASLGSVYEEVFRLLSKEQAIPELNFLGSFPDDDAMANVFSDHARRFDLSSYDHFVFSYHGLPLGQILKADRNNYCRNDGECCKTWSETNHLCYVAQCFETTRKITENLGLTEDQYSICFQSRLGREEWIKPYTPKILEERAKNGDKRLLVFSPAFVSDCLETTIEILDEYQEEWHEMGGEHLDLVESLNADPVWIKSVADRIVAAT